MADTCMKETLKLKKIINRLLFLEKALQAEKPYRRLKKNSQRIYINFVNINFLNDTCIKEPRKLKKIMNRILFPEKPLQDE